MRSCLSFRQTSTANSIRQFFSQQWQSQPQQQQQQFQSPPSKLVNGRGANNSRNKPAQDQPDQRVAHTSRLSSFQRENFAPAHQRLEPFHQSSSSSVRSYSPYQAYQNHLACLKDQAEQKYNQVGESYCLSKKLFNVV